MSFLPKDFSDFIKADCNRCDFIQNWLCERGIKTSLLCMEEKKHILLQFSSSSYNPQFRIKTVIAHYDRVLGSPGANDNSAAVWILMNWAIYLNSLKTCHNVRIIWTDGEELGQKNGVADQGSFALASAFKRLKMKNDDVYVFDACGRGEIPLLSRYTLPEKVSRKFIKSYADLHRRTEDLLLRTCHGRWMNLPFPYSDNASFLACGIPAVAITMLPSDEASLYACSLMKNPDLEKKVMNTLEKSHEENNFENGIFLEESIPYTWRLFHTEKDNLSSLTPESFTVMSSILQNLALTMYPTFKS